MNVLIDDIERTETGGRVRVLDNRGKDAGYARITKTGLEFNGKQYRTLKDGRQRAVLIEVIKENEQ